MEKISDKKRKTESHGENSQSKVSKNDNDNSLSNCQYCGLQNQQKDHLRNCSFKTTSSTDAPVIQPTNLARQQAWCPYESLQLCLQSYTSCRGIYPLIFLPKSTPDCPALNFFQCIGAVNDYQVLEEMIISSAGKEIILPKKGKVVAASPAIESPWSEFSHFTKPDNARFVVNDLGDFWKVSVNNIDAFGHSDHQVVVKNEIDEDEEDSIDFGMLECQVDITVKEESEDGSAKVAKTSEDKKDNFFKCVVCPIAFQFEKSLTSHMRHSHTKCICKLCQLTFKDAFLLEKHVAVAHRTDILKNPPSLIQSMISKAKDGNRFSCDVCDYETANVSSLKKHVSIKHEGEFFKCEYCQYTTRKHPDLLKHKQSIHQTNKFSCLRCSYCANSEIDLKKHHAIAHSTLQYDERVSSQQSVPYNMNNLPYCCNIAMCSFSTLTEKALKAHQTMKHSKGYNGRNITKMKASQWEMLGMKGKLNQNKNVETHEMLKKQDLSLKNQTTPSTMKQVNSGSGSKRKITKLNASQWAKLGIHQKIGEIKKEVGDTQLNKNGKAVEKPLIVNQAQNEVKKEVVADACKPITTAANLYPKQENEGHASSSEFQINQQQKDKLGFYACERCNFKGKQKSHIIDHLKSVHEGIRYPCDHCTYKATTTSSLYRHVRRKHKVL